MNHVTSTLLWYAAYVHPLDRRSYNVKAIPRVLALAALFAVKMVPSLLVRPTCLLIVLFTVEYLQTVKLHVFRSIQSWSVGILLPITEYRIYL